MRHQTAFSLRHVSIQNVLSHGVVSLVSSKPWLGTHIAISDFETTPSGTQGLIRQIASVPFPTTTTAEPFAFIHTQRSNLNTLVSSLAERSPVEQKGRGLGWLSSRGGWSVCNLHCLADGLHGIKGVQVGGMVTQETQGPH